MREDDILPYYAVTANTLSFVLLFVELKQSNISRVEYSFKCYIVLRGQNKPVGIFCLPPGGRGTAKRGKEPAGTIAQNKTFCGRIWNSPLRSKVKLREEQAPPLPSSEHIILPQPETIFSLRRQAKFHTAGISFADSGKFHSPQANFTVQPPTAVEPYASLREGGGPRSGGRSRRV